MDKAKSKYGQIPLPTLITIGATLALAIIGGWFTNAHQVDAKIETVKTAQTADTLALAQRVSANETDVKNLRSDITDIRSDVKELLRRVK